MQINTHKLQVVLGLIAVIISGFVLITQASAGQPAISGHRGLQPPRLLGITPSSTPTPCDPSWNVIPSPNVGSGTNGLNGVTVVSANDVWAVGSYSLNLGTLVEHWDGSQWSIISSPNPGTNISTLYGLAVVSTTEIWAVGAYSNSPSEAETLVEHWDGSQWSIISSPNPGPGYSYMYSAAVVSANDVWTVGYYDDGSGSQTLIEHWNGSAWSIVSSPNNGANNALNGVAAVSANDVWAVGVANGQTLVEHWNGSVWSIMSSPNNGANSFLNKVAAASANDVWAVGAGSGQTLVEHWNGSLWSVVSSPNNGANNALNGVAVVSANDVWAVGYFNNGQTLTEHWNGSAWSIMSSPNSGSSRNFLRGVAPVSANEVWAVGQYQSGSVYRTLAERYTNSCATTTSTPTYTPSNTLTGTPTNTHTSTVTPTNTDTTTPTSTSTYTPTDSPTITPTHTPTDTPTDTDTPTETPTFTLTPTATNTPDPCAPVWSVVSSPNVGTNDNQLNGVAAVSANDVWAVGYYLNGSQQTLVEHWNGTAWSVVASPNQGTSANHLNGVTAVSANDIWAVGYYYIGSIQQTLIEHWNGTDWSVVASPNQGTSTNVLYAIAAVSASDVWAVGYYDNGSFIGQTLVEHWNGTVWSVVPSPNQGTSFSDLNGVSAASANDVWAVGGYTNGSFRNQTLIEHWNGTSWSVVPSPNVDANHNILNGVSAVSANDVWAVGAYYNINPTGQTLIEHWDGTSWSVVPSPNVDIHNSLYGVEAVSANDVWAVGYYSNGSTIYETLVEHWSGASWSIVSSPNVGTNDNSLQGVTAVSASDVWAVGEYYNGNNISQTLVEHYISPCATPTGTPSTTPTDTLTPTPTTTPVIVGHVTWQGRPAQPSALQQLPITLTLKSSAGETNYPIQDTDAGGFFTDTVAALPNGLYLWRVKNPKYLANVGTVTLSGAAIASQEMGIMRAGDCDNDNSVSLSDFTILKSTFGKLSSQTGYDDRAEYNGDNVITLFDFTLLKGNFGSTGPPAIRPREP